jgi:natural product precursor
MFNQKIIIMKNLKLNQLNKQKLAENEMNAIEGGQAPHFVPAEWENYEAMTSCESHCVDYGGSFHTWQTNHSGVYSEFWSW